MRFSIRKNLSISPGDEYLAYTEVPNVNLEETKDLEKINSKIKIVNLSSKELEVTIPDADFALWLDNQMLIFMSSKGLETLDPLTKERKILMEVELSNNSRLSISNV
jgi:hypothetical protein